MRECLLTRIANTVEIDILRGADFLICGLTYVIHRKNREKMSRRNLRDKN